jgi:hypothetical protein
MLFRSEFKKGVGLLKRITVKCRYIFEKHNFYLAIVKNKMQDACKRKWFQSVIKNNERIKKR